MTKKVHLYALAQAFVAFLTGVYLTSLSDKKLLFGDDIFSKNAKNYILEHYIVALFILAGLTILIHYLSHRDSSSKDESRLYNNICQSVFDNFIKDEASYQNSEFRVSLFKAEKGIYFENGKWYKPTKGTYLRNVGRHQTKQEKKLSCVKYLPNEGCVGICYLNNILLFESISPVFDPDNPDDYYDKNLQQYNLPKRKSKKLNIKSSSFVCCPVKYFNSDSELFGVIIVDCISTQDFRSSNFRVIEEIIKNYSVVFNKVN